MRTGLMTLFSCCALYGLYEEGGECLLTLWGNTANVILPLLQGAWSHCVLGCPWESSELGSFVNDVKLFFCFRLWCAASLVKSCKVNNCRNKDVPIIVIPIWARQTDLGLLVLEIMSISNVDETMSEAVICSSFVCGCSVFILLKFQFIFVLG